MVTYRAWNQKIKKKYIAYNVGIGIKMMIPPADFILQVKKSIFQYMYDTKAAFRNERIAKRIYRYIDILKITLQ